jgi:hypothetical protein
MQAVADSVNGVFHLPYRGGDAFGEVDIVFDNQNSHSSLVVL